MTKKQKEILRLRKILEDDAPEGYDPGRDVFSDQDEKDQAYMRLAQALRDAIKLLEAK